MNQRSFFEKPALSLRPLRPRQATALEALRAAIREGHKRIVLQAPTGSGKTIIASHIIAGALAKGNRPMFCVPRLSLIGQTVERFESQGISDIGVIQGQHERTDFSAAVQVASVHTLVRRPLPEVDFVILDEVHLELESLNKILDSEAWTKKIVIGLSATPWTKGMGLRWTKLIVLATTNEMIAEGWLTPVVGFGVPDEFVPDVSHVHTNFDGDYVEGEAEKAMTTKKIVGNVVKTWLEKWGKDKTFMFCVNRSHARKMQKEFEDAGISCGYIDGTMDAEERERVFRKYRTSECRILASIDTVGVGVDEDVRCVIYLRLTKSEQRWVQDGGRGLRLADGKECIARDSLVLTQNGLVKIQDISLDHKVWDGVNFVHHGGAVCKGVREVIEHDGIVATPDHEVMTDDGFQRIADAKRRQAQIVTTGIGGNPIWFSEDRFPTHGRWWVVSPSCRGRMFELWSNPLWTFLQHEEATRHGGVPSLQREKAAGWNRYPEMAVREMQWTERSVLQPIGYSLRELWRKGDRVSFFGVQRCGEMDCGKSGDTGPLNGDRQDQQQRPLRAGESSVEFPSKADEQYAVVGRNPEAQNDRIPSELPPRQICGPYLESAHGSRLDGQGNTCEMGDTVIQTEREVWDILSAGPLQRFTVNGKLVHNCLLLLDHAGTAEELGLFTDIHHETLDMRDPKEKGPPASGNSPKPRKCPKCNALIRSGVTVCPVCGSVLAKPKMPKEVSGELVAIGKKEKKPEKGEKQSWYSQALGLARERNYTEGYAAWLYKDRFGVFPRNLQKVTTFPSRSVREFARKRQQEYRKSREGGQRAVMPSQS